MNKVLISVFQVKEITEMGDETFSWVPTIVFMMSPKF